LLNEVYDLKEAFPPGLKPQQFRPCGWRS
jgi:hypothetical protein